MAKPVPMDMLPDTLRPSRAVPTDLLPSTLQPSKAVPMDMLPDTLRISNEQPTPVDTTSQKPPEPRPEDQSFLRSVADVPLNITQGGATGIRMIADAFGADSSTSKTLRGVEDYLGSLMSAQSKQDKQEISRIMKEAEDKGVGDQVLAGLKALSIAPVDTISNALGTSAPAIIGGLGALFFGAPAAVVTGTAVGIGSVMGAGTIKSAVYDATKEELTKLKLPPDEVERRAEAAQAYSGKNLDQIAIGSALGGLSAFGFETATLKNIASNIVGKVAAKEAAETAVEKGVVRRVGENVVKEAVPEGAQGSQEQLAQNLALQREGIDTPTMRGVISQGVLEAGASAPLGAYAGLREKQPTADTTGAGDALRRLDELAAREEAGTTGEVTVPPSPPPSTPSTQSKELVDIYDSARGAQAFVNILKANRPKENFAFEETEDGRFAIYQIPVEETGGANVTPPITDTSGVGTENTGKPPEDTGTGVPPSSEGTGLGVSDTDATGAGVPKGVQPYTLTRDQFKENAPQVNMAAASVFSPNFQFTADVDQLLSTSTEEDIRLANKLLGLNPVVDIKRAAKNVANAYQNILTAYSLNSAQVEGMKLPELKELAKSLGLSTFGNKPELVEKINSFLPNAQAKFTERVNDHRHEQSVLNAVREGKPVSDEVLKDYPEIAAYGSPTGSAAYVAGVKKLAIKWLPTHLMEVPSTVQNLRDSAKESGVTAKEAQTLNDVADAMEEYHKNAFGKKEETSAAAPSVKEQASNLLAFKKITGAKYAALQEALKAQKAAIAEYESTPGARSDDRSSPEYHNLSVAVNAVAKANAEYEAAERAENKQYEEFRAAQKAETTETSTAPVKVDKLQQTKDKLKAVSDKLFSAYKQREQLPTSFGDLPAPNSKARKDHDALMDEIKELRRQKKALEMEIELAEQQLGSDLAAQENKPTTLNAKSEEDKLPRVDSIPRFSLGPTSITPTVVAEGKPLYRETNVDGINDLLRANKQFEFSGAFVTDNPDLALGQGNNKGVQVEFRPNSVSGEENKKPMTGDLAGREFKSNVIAPRAVQSVTFTKAKDFNRINGIAKRTLIAEFDRNENADGSITFTRKAEPSNKPSVSNAPAMSMEEGEKALDEQFTNVAETDMAPFIVEMINQNDINGALRAIASRTRGFYGELAARLAELNLSTGIYVGRQSAVLQQLINSEVGPQMEQIAQYMQTMFPNSMLTYTIKKHLNGDESGRNIADVYSALIDIESGIPNINGDVLTKEEIAPILPQLNDALKIYGAVEDSLTAPGFYVQRFNILNINPNVRDGMTYRTFLHEVVHAATQSLLDADWTELTEEQIETREELKKLFAIASLKGPVGEYGLTNIHEFVAELFTNAHFRNQLKKIPYPPARTNLLSKFINAIMKLVGMDNLAGRSMVIAEKLFTSQRYTPTSSFKINMANKTGPKKPRVRGPISAVWRVVEDTMESVKDWDNVKKDLLPAMWDAGNGVFRNTMLGVMNLRQIADVTKTKFPQIASSIRIIEKMLAYRGKIMNEGGDIIQRWTKAQAKNTKVSQLLGRVMLEATIRGVEVDPKSSNYDSAKVNKEMADAWDALGPDFQQIYRDVRDFYRRAVDETIRLMKERANKNADLEKREQLLADIDAQFGPDKLKGPYFPLRRFGEFWFQVGQGNFKEFYTYESRLDRNRAMAARKRELSKGNAQQRGLAESIHSGNGVSELYSQNVANTQILQDVQKIIDSVGDTVIDKTTGVSRDKSNAEVKDELKDSLNQLIYILLPQQSMRKMFINRKAIQGASGDMLRVFATHAVHSAYQRSRFKYAQEFMDNLSNAHDWVKNFAKGKDYEVYRDYINEVEKRSKTILGTEDTSLAAKVAGKASEATFFFMLSSPFTAMLNTIGFAQVAMPYIGGRYGYATTNKRILENMGKYLKTAPTRTFSPLTKGHMSQVSFPSIVEGGQLEGILKDAAQQLLDEEQINISLTNDVFDIGSRPSATYTGTVNAVKRAVSGLFHQSERLNREITLLSVVELAYEKLMSEPIKDARGIVQRDAQGQPMRYTDNATTSDGKTQYSQEALQAAINEAKDIAGLALGDFTRQMKPRFFTPPLMSVLTKFKQYSVMASYAIIRNAHLGLIKPFSTKELDALRQELEEHYEGDLDKDAIVKQQMEEAQAQQKEVAKEARRRLAGILGMSYLFGGYAAMPFFSLLTPILVAMLAGDDDDDDEFFNWENWFKNYMEKEFGGYVGAMLQKFGVEETAANKAGRKVGETLMYGPGSTVTGGALSDRVSLDLKNLWYRDGRYSPDTRESVVENIIANAGPVVGLTVNAMEAWDMAQKGQVGRAFEKMAPALFSKPVTAARLATEGGKTKGGDTLVDEFTSAELAIQAVGLQPLRLSQAQKASIETVQKAQKITNKHDSIMNRLWMERDNGEAFNDALEDAIKFSEQHPGYAITAKKIKESFEKRAKDSAMAGVFGARIPKPLQGELMDMPDYGKE